VLLSDSSGYDDGSSRRTNQERIHVLAVANPVDEERLHDLPQAEDIIHVDEATRNREEQTKQFKAKIQLGIIFVVAHLMSILMF
jgi:hypothetical protein